MKKLLVTLISALFSFASFAQDYPLESTHVYGRLTADTSLHLTNPRVYFGSPYSGAGGRFLLDTNSLPPFFPAAPYLRYGVIGNFSGIGYGNGTQYWDTDSIGYGSFVFGGINNRATSINAFTIGGVASYSAGLSSMNIGATFGVAADTGAVNISGASNQALEKYSFNISGTQNVASGRNSFNIGGSQNEIVGEYGATIGSQGMYIDALPAGFSQSMALASGEGYLNKQYSVDVGGYQDTIQGVHSISLGSFRANSNSYHGVFMGQLPPIVVDSAETWWDDGYLILVGNGDLDLLTRSSAFGVKKNGVVWTGTVADPDNDLQGSEYTLQNYGQSYLGGAVVFAPITAAEASALTPAAGMVVYVSDTNGTFTQVGGWMYVNGTWTALH